MKHGLITAGDLKVDSTGALTVASGSTEQRPQDPTNGMYRYNDTTECVEHFSNSAWNNMPILGDTFVTAQSLEVITGVSSGDMLYWRDPHTFNKTLSVMMLSYRFSVGDASDNAWLQVDPLITGSSIGYITPTPITLMFLSGFTDANVDKTISLYIDDTEYPEVMVFPAGVSEQALSLPINIDVDKNAKIRLQVKSPLKDKGPIVCNLYYMMRKPTT